MTVRELIEDLQTRDLEAEVIISKDAEGNSFSPLSCPGCCYYRARNSWSGEIYPSNSEEDLKLKPAIVLWPVN